MDTYVGVDLGIRKSGICIIKSRNIEFYYVSFEELIEILSNISRNSIVCVDAPLTYGEKYRDCDLAIKWAKPLPLNLPSMRKLMQIGIKLREYFENKFTIIESFTRGVKLRLRFNIEDFLDKRLKSRINVHELDGLYLAFNSYLYSEGLCEGFGKECKIFLPKSYSREFYINMLKKMIEEKELENYFIEL